MLLYLTPIPHHHHHHKFIPHIPPPSLVIILPSHHHHHYIDFSPITLISSLTSATFPLHHLLHPPFLYHHEPLHLASPSFTSTSFPSLPPQIPEFDNLYLDMNGIIHICSHPNDNDPHFRISEEKMFKDIFHYIEVGLCWGVCGACQET